MRQLPCLLATCLLIFGEARAGFSESRAPPKRTLQPPNRVKDVETSCTRDSLEVRVQMERPFKGVIFSKDFSRECRSQGTMENTVNLHFPPNACGVRTSAQNRTKDSSIEDVDDAEGLHYSVSLVVQMDRHLQQAADQHVVVKCWLKPTLMRIRSEAVEDMIDEKLKQMKAEDKKNARSGRMRKQWSEFLSEEQRAELMQRARAWMELVPAEAASGADDDSTVRVGELTRLLVKSTLPDGIGLRITDCMAHDGLGEASQKLLDEVGCPIDELIFPRPQIEQHRPKMTEVSAADLEQVDSDTSRPVRASRDPQDIYKHIMSYQHATTTFFAFKFPDRARLHINCELELCKSECPPIDCKSLKMPHKTKEGLLRKARLDKDAKSMVIDRLEVYNSIEVIAPNIDLEEDVSVRSSKSLHGDDIDSRFSPGDRTVCLSPSKMALAFCVLGLIFLSALVVAFISLMRTRKKYGTERFSVPLSIYTGTKSILSATASTGSVVSGSKLLLTDSPYLDHRSSTGNWPYGRVY